MDQDRHGPIRVPDASQALHLASLIRRMLSERCETPPSEFVRATTISEACIIYDVRLVTNAVTGIDELLATFLADRLRVRVPEVLDRLTPTPASSPDGRSLLERSRDLVRSRSAMPMDRFEEYLDDFALTYATQGVEVLVSLGAGIIKALVELGTAREPAEVIERLRQVSEPLIRAQYPSA